MMNRWRRGPAVLALLATLLLAALLASGCAGREFGPGETAAGTSGSSGGSNTDSTADAARTKLALQVQDPCYDGDARAAWPRCGRWVEETVSSARTAAGALPTDRGVTDGAQAVVAGHDAFLARGCGTSAGGGSPADPAACVGALGQARDGVRTLVRALGGVPGA